MSAKGKLIPNAISWISKIIISAAVNFSSIFATQKDDELLQSLEPDNKYVFKEFLIFGTPSSICCKIFEKGPRAYITAVFVRKYFGRYAILLTPALGQ